MIVPLIHYSSGHNAANKSDCQFTKALYLNFVDRLLVKTRGLYLGLYIYFVQRFYFLFWILKTVE